VCSSLTRSYARPCSWLLLLLPVQRQAGHHHCQGRHSYLCLRVLQPHQINCQALLLAAAAAATTTFTQTLPITTHTPSMDFTCASLCSSPTRSYATACSWLLLLLLQPQPLRKHCQPLVVGPDSHLCLLVLESHQIICHALLLAAPGCSWLLLQQLLQPQPLHSDCQRNIVTYGPWCSSLTRSYPTQTLPITTHTPSMDFTCASWCSSPTRSTARPCSWLLLLLQPQPLHNHCQAPHIHQ
jgi:hypothetical protein